MKKITLLLVTVFYLTTAFSQKLNDGKYIFKFFDEEYGKATGTCEVEIKMDSIFVYAKDGCHIKNGELLAKGILIKHKSGKWIIGKNQKDKDAKKIGVYNNELFIVDIKKKISHST